MRKQFAHTYECEECGRATDHNEFRYDIPAAAVRTNSTEAVFVNEAGHPREARNLLRAFYSAMRKAGITRFRFHDLRHTFATRLIRAGVDVYTVQKLGRWKTISMVQRHAHHQPESLRGGAEVLDRLRRESSTGLAQSVVATKRRLT